MVGIFGQLYGMPVLINNDLEEERQSVFPRGKKKRIRKKYTKNKKNWKGGFPFTGVYFLKPPFVKNESIMMRKETLHKIKEKINGANITRIK